MIERIILEEEVEDWVHRININGAIHKVEHALAMHCSRSAPFDGRKDGVTCAEGRRGRDVQRQAHCVRTLAALAARSLQMTVT